MSDTKKQRGETGKSDPHGSGSAPGRLVGLDIGYGFTKVIRDDGEQVMFPSAVAAVPPTIVGKIRDVQAEDEVVVDGVRCIVGARAIGKDDRYSNLHSMWYTATPYKAIIAYAKRWIPARSSIVTGLPLHQFTVPESRETVKNTVKAGLHAKDVRIMPQGVGAYFSDPAFAHPTTKVAVVDIGTWTTELVGMAGWDLLNDVSAGYVLGVNDIFAKVAHELDDKLGRPIDLYEVERAYRDEGEIRYEGRTYAQETIKERITAQAKERAGQILAKMVNLWGPHAPAFESVLFCGGGAQFLFPFLKTFRSGSVLVADAQFANARGYLNIAKQMYNTEGPPATSTQPMVPVETNGQAVTV